jgi:enoyl-CoA hydratase/carnithine racemase
MMDSGDFHPAAGARELGLADRVLSQDEVQSAAIAKATALAAFPAEAFAAIKGNRTEPIADQILARLEEKEGRFLRYWSSPQTQALLREAMKTF